MNSPTVPGSGVLPVPPIDVSDGTNVSLAWPLAFAATLIVAVKSSEPTPLKLAVLEVLLGLFVSVRLRPLTVLELTMTVAPVPPLNLTPRSVRLKPVGAMIVKLSVLDVPARALKSKSAVKPPLSAPDVFGVTATPVCRALDKLLEKLAKTFPLTLHPLEPMPTKPAKVPVVHAVGLARLTVDIAKMAATITKYFRIQFSSHFFFFFAHRARGSPAEGRGVLEVRAHNWPVGRKIYPTNYPFQFLRNNRVDLQEGCL